VPEPGLDDRIVALPSPGHGAVRAPVVGVQRPAEIPRVVADPELPSDQRRDTLEGPLLAGEARRRRAAPEQGEQPLPPAPREPGRGMRPRPGAELAIAAVTPAGAPAADRRGADAQLAGDRRLGHGPGPKPRRGLEPSLFQLGWRQLVRVPRCRHTNLPRQIGP
jgi:hypothetical protein